MEIKRKYLGLKRSEDLSTRLHLLLCDSKCNLNVNVEIIIPILPIYKVDVRIKILNEGSIYSILL